jgi:hypothetical protein
MCEILYLKQTTKLSPSYGDTAHAYAVKRIDEKCRRAQDVFER